MKRLLPLLLLLTLNMIQAQTKTVKTPNQLNPPNQQNPHNPSNPGPRCAADLHLQQYISKHPAYQKTILQANSLLNKEVKRRIDLSLQRGNLAESAMPVNIPVVIHIVLPDPSMVTDAMVQYQVDKLNTDFSGFNADSTNLVPMFSYSLRGHSNIRFVLAKKDPLGNLTTGIERRCSNTYFTTEEREPIKLTSEGGLDAWNPEKYINIWVGNTMVDGLLGYSTYPYSIPGYQEPPIAFHGITIKQQAFANNTSVYSFNRGRTLVHEMGHFFGLFHIFQGACNSEDFSLATFDPGNTDDTPPQVAATGYGSPGENACPSGIASTGCTGTPNGRLYQNYMDYTDDPCMSMFTANQVVRMETALDLFKPTLKVSDAGNPPPVFSKDIQVLATIGPNAGNAEFMECNSAITPLNYCSSGNSVTIAPVLKIKNAGTSVISEMEVWYRLGTGTPVLNSNVQLATPLAPSAIGTLQLNPIVLTGGVLDLQLYTSNPDKIADENVVNDTIHLALTIELPSVVPVTEGFENPAFPPDGWKVNNLNADGYTWERTEAAARTGIAGVYMNFFDYDKPGRIDELISPAIDISFADSIIFDFSHAYKQFDTSVKDFSDSLEILVSEDCGAGFKTIWKKGGAGLATASGATGLFSWAPSAGEWVTTSMDLRPLVAKSASTLRVVFRGKNGYGQNLFLDDISLRTVVKPIRDAGIVAVQTPSNRVCDGTFIPSIIIENLGEDTLRTLKVSYSLDGGAVNTMNWTGKLRKFQQQQLAFDQVTVSGKGVHQLAFAIDSPNNLQDQNPGNDTIKWRLMVFDVTNAPLNEGFENTVFPPDGWEISAFDKDFQWRKNTSASSRQLASAWVNNRMNTVKGTREELYSPIIQLGRMDSVLVTFDLSHITNDYPATASPTDTLQVLLTTDCGKTFTSVYRKWGTALNTLKEPYQGNTTRDSLGFQPNLKSHWRTDSINITKALGVSSQFQLVFRNINNNDNNIFLDNITVNPVILPDVLKHQGFQVMPNPTTGLVYVRHYLPPLNLEGIQVVNARGQLVLTRRYKGNALSTIPLDLSNHAAGLYTIRLLYRDKIITEKIIKVN